MPSPSTRKSSHPVEPPGPVLAPLAGLIGLVGVLLTGWLALSQPWPEAPNTTTVGALPAPDRGRTCAMTRNGFLRGRFFGALAINLDWSGPDLLCDGMVRPNGAGVRLFFAREQPGGGRLVLVVGIDGQPDQLVGGEHPANITVIDERDGRFFSSGGAGRCWADINTLAPLAGRTESRIEGTLYCAGALPALQDRSSLTLGDIEFAGRFSTDGG